MLDDTRTALGLEAQQGGFGRAVVVPQLDAGVEGAQRGILDMGREPGLGVGALLTQVEFHWALTSELWR